MQFKCIHLFISHVGYHNRLAEKSDRRKQSLWVVIRILKDEERSVRLSIRKVDTGHPAPATKLKYRRLERRIRSLKRQYRRGVKTLDEYWAAITHVVGQFN